MNKEKVLEQEIDYFSDIYDDRKILKEKDNISNLDDNYKKMYTEIIKQDVSFREISVGEIIEGTIKSINEKEIIIDINYKDYLYVDNKLADIKIIDNLKVGDTIDVVITDINEDPFYIKGSITELIKLNVYDKLKEHYYNNKSFIATVTEMQPAGFLLDIEMDNVVANAFMPTTLAGINKLTDFQKDELVGKKIEVMLETLQQEKGIYVVSRRKYLQSLIPDEIYKVKQQFFKDKYHVYKGYVTGTKDFGIFVEFNECLTGMIHRYNVSSTWTSDENWKKIVPGMEIEFYVKEVIPKKQKIILTQIIRESLWDTIEKDSILDGTVISVKPFGTLIKLDQETNGLIQSSYLEKKKIELKLGDKVKVRVLTMNKDERKINLAVVK